jgi:hypothetical protein
MIDTTAFWHSEELRHDRLRQAEQAGRIRRSKRIQDQKAPLHRSRNSEMPLFKQLLAAILGH